MAPDQRIVRPDPDPTERTIEQSLREVANVEKFLMGQIKALQGLIEEKLVGVATQFSMRDTALTAAFKAAQDAVTEQNRSNEKAATKSEESFTKQIDQMKLLIETKGKASDDKIDDIKETMSRREGHSKGLGDGWGYLVGAIGVVWGVVATFELITKH
jgi:hypothetical protein